MILIINGHPDKQSLCTAVCDAYIDELKICSKEYVRLDLSSLNFDPVMHSGYKQDQELEKDLLNAQKLIKESDHIVFVYPSWWGNVPALLKGFIDRTFTPGFAFKYHHDKPLPEKLLTGKSARLIVTMDAPSLYYRWIQGASGDKMMKNSILKFCGINPVKITHLDRIRGSSEERIKKLIDSIKSIAQKDLSLNG